MMSVSGLSDTHTHRSNFITRVTASDRDSPVMAYIRCGLLQENDIFVAYIPYGSFLWSSDTAYHATSGRKPYQVKSKPQQLKNMPYQE